MKKIALITAGGKGLRMGADLPKQFVPIAGKPLLMHTVQRFLEAMPETECYLVLPKEHIAYWQTLCKQYAFNAPCCVIKGGETRFHSAKNGLDAIPDTEGLVAVHDGVRPFPSQAVIAASFRKAEESGSAVPIVPVNESLRQLEQTGSRPVDRSRYRLVQTPQTFRLKLLREAYKQPYNERFTDDASVVEAMGGTISLIDGNRENIKITHPEDLLWAEIYLEQLSSRPKR